MRALVTGANGFIGSHVVRALLAKGHSVRALIRPTSDLRSLEGLDVEMAIGDIQQPDTLTAAMEGCDWVFHVAGVFSYWRQPPEQLIGEAKEGARHVMAAAKAAGVCRMVLTSSSVVFGCTGQQRILDEAHPGSIESAPAYVLAKKAQVDAAFEMAKDGAVELVSVHPTVVVGGHDYGLTESNHHIVSYLQDLFKTSWIGGCNIASVQDVAQGHILAAENGRSGERYLLGGENLEWQAIHQLISSLTGMPGPYLKVYHTAAYLASALQEALSLLTNDRPISTREQAKMVGNYYWYSHQKAAEELGYVGRSAKAALIEAISWLAASEHVSPSIRSQFELSPEIYAHRQSFGISLKNQSAI
jgi:dihydroflavonol-4-reductase